MYMLFTPHLGFYLKFRKRNTLLKQSQTYQPLRTKNTGRGERAGAWQGHGVATAPPRHPPPIEGGEQSGDSLRAGAKAYSPCLLEENRVYGHEIHVQAREW